MFGVTLNNRSSSRIIMVNFKSPKKVKNVEQNIFMTDLVEPTLLECKLFKSTMESDNHMELGGWEDFEG
jgi:hypothetical protein